VIAAARPRRVLEIGTLQSVPGQSTHSRAWFPDVERSDYVLADIAAGADVDVVVDIHELPREWTARFDAFVALAVWEHLARPWIAAQEVGRILAPGGICYVETHQTFPLHGYPSDYFRFSREALALIFTDAGLKVVEVGYHSPAKIIAPPEVVPWSEDAPSWLNVALIGRKR
jgi:SAM-dependent methyltransferase